MSRASPPTSNLGGRDGGPARSIIRRYAATWIFLSTADATTSERVLTRLAGTPILVNGTHFAGATAGRIVRDGELFGSPSIDGERNQNGRGRL